MRVLLASLGALVFLASSAAADVYTVRGVEVDETADSLADARRRAISNGQLIAARRLIERLTREADRAAAPPLDAAGASRLVSGYQVEEERQAGGRRYIARLTVEFDPGAVRNLFESYGVPYVVSTARPAVAVPLWREGGEIRLWQDNPWLEAWRVAGTSDELVPVIAPSGDFTDLAAVNAARAAELDLEALERLASNYGAVRALVALAEPAGPGAAPTTTTQAAPEADAGADMTEAEEPAAGIDAAAGEPAEAEPEQLYSVRMIGVDFSAGGELTDFGVVGVGTLAELARQSAALLQEEWKAEVFVSEPFLSDLQVSVVFDSMREWAALQDTIGGEPLVQLARLEALTSDGALMQIQYRGTQDQLELVLRERGAELTRTPRGGWIISAAGAGEELERAIEEAEGSFAAP